MYHVRRSYRMLSIVEELRKVLEPGSTMVEVGSLAGESALGWAACGLFSEVYCVDPWDVSSYSELNRGTLVGWDRSKWIEAENTFDQLCKVFPLLKKRKGRSVDVAAEMAEQGMRFDFIYIDAFHSYEATVDDIKSWFPLLRKGGIIGGHDYHRGKFSGIVQAVEELLGEVKIFPEKSWIALDVRGGDSLK